MFSDALDTTAAPMAIASRPAKTARRCAQELPSGGGRALVSPPAPLRAAHRASCTASARAHSAAATAVPTASAHTTAALGSSPAHLHRTYPGC